MPDNLGELEQLVMLALLRLGEDAYGIPVQQELARVARRRATFATVYSTLQRLESKGFVKSRIGDPTPERGGRRMTGRDRTLISVVVAALVVAAAWFLVLAPQRHGA